MSEKKNSLWPMTSEQTFIAAAVFVSFFVLWFLWAAVGDKFICWIGGKSNLSGWVQAVGSVLAIVATALGTRWQILKSKDIQDYNEKINNIHMSDTCLEMCNAIFSIINDKDNFLKKSMSTMSDGVFIYNDNFRSLERVSDLQETIRLLIMKNLPVELLKALFQLQKIIAKYKEELLVETKIDHKLSNKNSIHFKITHKNIRDDVNKQIRNIVAYKNKLSCIE